MTHWKGPPQHWTLAFPLLAAMAGILILLGLWTPFAGVLAVLANLDLFTLSPGNASETILFVGVGISLSMLGPGAWSIDARIFGRRRVVISEP